MQSSVQVLWVKSHYRSDYFELWGFVIWSIVRFLWTYKSCHCWTYLERLDLRILQHIEEELWFGCGQFVNSSERLLWREENLKIQKNKLGLWGIKHWARTSERWDRKSITLHTRNTVPLSHLSTNHMMIRDILINKNKFIDKRQKISSTFQGPFFVHFIHRPHPKDDGMWVPTFQLTGRRVPTFHLTGGTYLGQGGDLSSSQRGGVGGVPTSDVGTYLPTDDGYLSSNWWWVPTSEWGAYLPADWGKVNTPWPG